MERAGANELLGSAHSQVRVGRGFASLVRLDCFSQVVVDSCVFRSRVLGLRARRRAGEAAVLPTRSSFAPAAGAAARRCSTPRRSVRGCRRILEEPAPSARRLLFLPTHRALFLTSCRGAEGLAPVALRSRTGRESGERLRISRTPQRNHFCLGPSAVAPLCRGALSSPRRRAWIGVPAWRYARASPRFPSPIAPHPLGGGGHGRSPDS